MGVKEIIPQLGLASFSCPHCGALAHQNWFHILADSVEQSSTVGTIDEAMVDEFIKALKGDDKHIAKWRSFRERFQKNEVTYENLAYSSSSNWRMVNAFLSRCHSCEGFSFWLKDDLVWPERTENISPHSDMPANVIDDFREASDIVKRSPRGSAALSRLVLQKLMVALGERGENINEDIASLVKKGLELEIQQALDIVRVVGNNAVHPGEIDLKDDTSTALALLQLINLVVERRIATQKRIAELFENLPPGAIDKIAKRDAPKG